MPLTTALGSGVFCGYAYLNLSTLRLQGSGGDQILATPEGYNRATCSSVENLAFRALFRQQIPQNV